MTDRKTATCACGEPKYPESQRCQKCHIGLISKGTSQRHARNRRRKAAPYWAKRVMAGEPISIRPGVNMSNEEFKVALRAAIEKVNA